MPLDKFIGRRLVVLSPETRIYDAVRAMDDNGIGAVLVHDGKALVGIVTDRDLAVKALGDDFDVFEFQLRDVMSSPVISVAADATVTDVTDLMVRERIRRVPILDGPSIAGVVTFDDLILERAVDGSTLAAIVRSQLSRPSRLEPAGRLRPAPPERVEAARQRADRRHEAHRRQAYASLLSRTRSATGLASIEQVESALEIVLSGLLRRVTAEEATNLLAQLPSHLRQKWLPKLARRPDLEVTSSSLERELEQCLKLAPDRAAEVLRAVGGALRTGISQGEIDDFRSQLPADMKEILMGPPEAHRTLDNPRARVARS